MTRRGVMRMIASSSASPAAPALLVEQRLFGGAADLQAPHPPRIARRDVVDNEGHLRFRARLRNLLTARHLIAGDVDGAQPLIEREADRAVLRVPSGWMVASLPTSACFMKSISNAVKVMPPTV